MTYQSLAKLIMQITLTLMVVVFAWVSYHQFMGMESMDSMSCETYCFIATKVDMNELVQSIYYSFTNTISAGLALLAITALAYLALHYLRDYTLSINPLLQRFRRYYYSQRWKIKLFSLWSTLYHQGIVAPQVYS